MHAYQTGSRCPAKIRCAVLAASVVVSMLAAGAASAQFSQRSPYGSPFGQQQDGQDKNDKSSGQSTVNQGVDPIAGGSNSRIDPVEITDRAPAAPLIPSADSAAAAAKFTKLPAKPNEFEQFIERAVGHKLPRFGADLMLPGDRDFAMPATATVPPDYILNVGDVVTISLTGSTEGSVEREIDTDGAIFLPKVGVIHLAGVRYGDLRQAVSNAVGRQYRGYDVTVGIRRLRGVRVYVTGFANNPGAFTVNSLSTLVNAVLAAGGPASGGSFRSVKLYRRGRLVSDFDLYQLLLRGDHRGDAILQNEDTLVIPPVGPQVAVTGSVNAEAIYELKPGETVADVLAFAGGTNVMADGSRVILYKLADRATTGSRELPVASLATMPAAGGDLLQILSDGSLQQSIVRQSAIVRVEGEVNRPGNYYVPAGTSIAQVMEMAGGTTERAYMFGARVERASVRRQQAQAITESINQLEATLAAAPLTASSAIDAGTREAQLAGARGFLDKLKDLQPDGRIILDISPDATALPGELIAENNDRILIPARSTTVGVFGAVYRPSSFLIRHGKGVKVRDYVAEAGGPIRAADMGHLLVVRANGSVVPKNKGALEARVLPGDLIFIPVKTQNSSIWQHLTQISAVVSQVALTAAALAVISQ